MGGAKNMVGGCMGIEVLIIGLQLRIIRRVQCIDVFVLWLNLLGCYPVGVVSLEQGM